MWFHLPADRGLAQSAMTQPLCDRLAGRGRGLFSLTRSWGRGWSNAPGCLAVKSRTITQILGSAGRHEIPLVDDVFGATSEHPIFDQALRVYCDGGRDQATVDISANHESPLTRLKEIQEEFQMDMEY